MIHRSINISPSRSFMLFGARGTGKSTFLRQQFGGCNAMWLDLLDPVQEDRYSRNPGELSEQLRAMKSAPEWVVIDEVQKVPRLLDVVHAEIERGTTKFALTGSSARKLKKHNTNLLAGRASVYHLFPFTVPELGSKFELESALRFGTLPGLQSCVSDDDKNAFLRAYALTYLKEEVWAEHLLRLLDPFRRFLEISAQINGEIVNCTNVAHDVSVDVKTVQSYFQIMEDTLVGFLLEPFHKSIRKRQLQAPKFYLFDPGIRRALARTLTVEIRPGTYDFGRAFEHFVIVEAIRRSVYVQNDYTFSYLRTKDGAEIDLVIERPGKGPVLMEIKSSDHVDARDTRTLEQFLPDLPDAEAYCISRDPVVRQIGSVRAMPWETCLLELGL